MGSRIADRLLNHGYQLSVYDMDPAKTQVIAAQGAAIAENIPETSGTAGGFRACLTNDEAVRRVYTEPEGIFAGGAPAPRSARVAAGSARRSRELHRLGARGGI